MISTANWILSFYEYFMIGMNMSISAYYTISSGTHERYGERDNFSSENLGCMKYTCRKSKIGGNKISVNDQLPEKLKQRKFNHCEGWNS